MDVQVPVGAAAPVGLGTAETTARRRRGEGNSAVRGSARGSCAPTPSRYFDAADPVFPTVLPALLVWFAVLSVAYRFRVPERLLGIAHLPSAGTPVR